MPRKGEEEGWPGKGAKRKKGRAKTGQQIFMSCHYFVELGPWQLGLPVSERRYSDSFEDFGPEWPCSLRGAFSNVEHSPDLLSI